MKNYQGRGWNWDFIRHQIWFDAHLSFYEEKYYTNGKENLRGHLKRLWNCLKFLTEYTLNFLT